MITQNDLGGLPGSEVYDDAGERIGPVTLVFVDQDTGDPLWAVVRTGAASFEESFVPLQGARFGGGRLDVATSRARVKQAPLLNAH